MVDWIIQLIDSCQIHFKIYWLACTGSESNESEETCTQCASHSRGRFLSVNRCVGKLKTGVY